MDVAHAVFLGFIFFAMIASGVAAAQVAALMTDEVNRKRSTKNILWPYGASFDRMRIHQNIRGEYRTLYPDGTLDRRLTMFHRAQVASGIAFILWIASSVI